MNTSQRSLRKRLGALSAGLFAAAVLTVGAPSAAADPLSDLLCSLGSSQSCRTQPAPDTSVYYKNCAEVRAAGKAPLLRGQPGYGAHLDRDNDGIACE